MQLDRPKYVDSYATVAIDAAAATLNQVLVSAPAAGLQIVVYGWQGTADTGDGTIEFQDEDDVSHSGAMPIAQNGGYVTMATDWGRPLMIIAEAKALELDTITCGFKGILQYGLWRVN